MPRPILLTTLHLALALSLASGNAASQRIIYVSQQGDDRWTGAKPDRVGSGTDGPVRSLERALQILRALKSEAKGKPGAITISIRGGMYRIERGIHLSAEDSGTTDAPILWQSYAGERVLLVGSRAVTDFHPLKEITAAKRIEPPFRDSILVANLREAGITEFGQISPRGTPGLEVFFRGKRMPLARWPNSGWERIAGVPQSGDSMLNAGLEREKRFDGVPVGRHYGRISYEGSRPSGWSPDTDIYLHGYWTFDWSDAFQKVASIDTLKHEITLSPPHHNYGYTKNQRFYCANVVEELDTPGEWYLDRNAGLLYFWPPEKLDSSSVSVSTLAEPFFLLDGVSYARIEGFDFAESREGAIIIRGGTGNLIAGCSMHNLGGEAVLIDGGTDNGIESSDLFDLALGAITLRGGDRKSLIPGRHFALNNHIHHFGQWIRTGQYACILDGVGHRMAHNEIHDAPFEAVYLRGNDHVVEFNNIHHVTQESGDAGALHTGRNWTWQGNIIRYNYFHELQGPGLHGVMGVYLDDWASWFTVFGNVFYRAGRATLIGGGRDNRVENNIYAECSPSIHIDARGLGWAGYYFRGATTELFDEMKEVQYDKPPYSVRYPQLLTMYDGETAVPKHNIIKSNISWGGRWMDVYDFHAFDFSVVKIEDNLIADQGLLRRRKAGQPGWDPYYIDIDMKEGYELLSAHSPEARSIFRNNRFVNDPPGTIEPRTGKFTRRSALSIPNFKTIPFDSIGLQRDRFRRLPE